MKSLVNRFGWLPCAESTRPPTRWQVLTLAREVFMFVASNSILTAGPLDAWSSCFPLYERSLAT